MAEAALLENIKYAGTHFDPEKLKSLREELDFFRGNLQRGIERIDALLEIDKNKTRAFDQLSTADTTYRSSDFSEPFPERKLTTETDTGPKDSQKQSSHRSERA